MRTLLLTMCVACTDPSTAWWKVRPTEPPADGDVGEVVDDEDEGPLEAWEGAISADRSEGWLVFFREDEEGWCEVFHDLERIERTDCEACEDGAWSVRIGPSGTEGDGADCSAADGVGGHAWRFGRTGERLLEARDGTWQDVGWAEAYDEDGMRWIGFTFGHVDWRPE